MFKLEMFKYVNENTSSVNVVEEGFKILMHDVVLLFLFFNLKLSTSKIYFLVTLIHSYV